MAQTLKLRCFMEQDVDHVYAHCIDLTLDATARTPHEAVEQLDNAIIQYLRWAIEQGLPLEHVRRPSPWTFRLRYWRAWVMSHLPRPPRRAPRPPRNEGIFTREPRLASSAA